MEDVIFDIMLRKYKASVQKTSDDLGEHHTLVEIFKSFEEFFEVAEKVRKEYNACADPDKKETIRKEAAHYVKSMWTEYNKIKQLLERIK